MSKCVFCDEFSSLGNKKIRDGEGPLKKNWENFAKTLVLRIGL
jgi:hypothetical protein